MSETNTARLYLAGFVLILAGFAIVFLGSAGSSSSSFGGVVFVGPIPFVFGIGPDSGTLVLVAVLISIAMIAMFFLSVILARKRPPYV